MVKQRNKISVALMVFGIVVMLVVVFWVAQKTKVGIHEATIQAAEVIPMDLSKTTEVEIASPDGKYVLTMESKKKADGLTQTFFTHSEKEPASVTIYSTESTTTNFVSVPYNSFSPDDKYVLLKEEKSTVDYFVLRTDAKYIREDRKTVKLIETFKQKYPDLQVTDVTGWGGVNLIILNTNTENGKIGPSFWFDLSNLAFIKLGTRFN